MSMFPSYDNAPMEDNTSIGFTSTEPMFKLIEYSIDQIVQKIENIKDLSDQDIKDIIIRQHKMILDYDLFLSHQRQYAQKLFSNLRFLKLLADIAGTLDLSIHEKICINKLSYDYYRSPNPDPQVFNALLQVSNVINQRTVTLLSSQLGSIRYSNVLAMIAKSSFRDDKNTHRINNFIMNYDVKELTPKEIANIYCYLFDHLTVPFTAAMMEIKLPNLSNLQLIRFDNISQAMIILINSMATPELHTMLSNYAYMIRLSNAKEVRFSLRSVTGPSDDILVQRLQNVIRRIENETGDDLKIP